MIAVDLAGRIFGRLRALRVLSLRKNKKIVWRCRCSCGNLIGARGGDLTSGKIKSCQCLKRETTIKRNKEHPPIQHGMTRSSEYATWKAMRDRCKNRRNRYWKDYGGRGIRVCKRWERSFLAFLTDMGPRPAGLTLERKDNDGSYTPRNCTWATRSQQNRNRRRRSR